jgi:hypothetical protein
MRVRQVEYLGDEAAELESYQWDRIVGLGQRASAHAGVLYCCELDQLDQHETINAP